MVISYNIMLPPPPPPCRHAQDVRQMYQQKLRNANRLYRRLSTCKKEMDAKELQLLRYIHIHGWYAMNYNFIHTHSCVPNMAPMWKMVVLFIIPASHTCPCSWLCTSGENTLCASLVYSSTETSLFMLQYTTSPKLPENWGSTTLST